MSVIAVHDIAALPSYVPAWESLAAAAVEPNVFHEPWMMLPALREFGGGQQLLFLLVFGPDPARPKGLGLLCGFFPLERQGRYKGLPIPHLRIWRHLHSFLSTPLLRAGRGSETLQALFDWLGRERGGSSLLELGLVSADGPFQQLLIDHLNEHGRLSCVEETTTRGLLRVGDDGEAYLRTAMSGDRHKKMRQKRRRLGQLGRLETRLLESEGELETWIEWFLQLEANGWKGREGTALAVHENQRRFFHTIAKEAFARQRLMMLGLFLNAKPVALKCSLLMGQGAVGFKTAYDEDYAQYSPGMLLVADNILQVHARPELQWMDSCAVSQAELFNRLYRERRLMQTLLVSTGRRGGDLTVSLLPLLRWLKRLARWNPSP